MVRLLGLMAAPAAAAVFALGVPAHAQAGVKAVHWIEWRHSGLCLTAKSENAGSPVVLARCGHDHQAWNVTGRRVRLAGTHLVLGINRRGAADLAAARTRRATWRYLPRRRALKNLWQSRRSRKLIVLWWPWGSSTGHAPRLNIWWRSIRSSERWTLPRA